MRFPGALRAATAGLAGALFLLFAPDCAREASAPVGGARGGGGAGGAAAEEGVVIGAAVWTLTWDRSGTVAADRGGWSVDTDLGYHVRVVTGWILDHSVSLGPCVVPADAGSSALGIHFGIRAAHAHEDADPSTIFPMHADDLALPEDAGPWPSVFPKERYCRAQWLVARATAPTDAPEGLDFSQTSVRVAGTWERDGEVHDLAVSTWWPEGHVEDLSALVDPAAFAAAREDGDVRWAWVTVRRRLGGLFDGIDFAVASDLQVAGRLLDNLLGQGEMSVELRHPTAQ